MIITNQNINNYSISKIVNKYTIKICIERFTRECSRCGYTMRCMRRFCPGNKHIDCDEISFIIYTGNNYLYSFYIYLLYRINISICGHFMDSYNYIDELKDIFDQKIYKFKIISLDFMLNHETSRYYNNF